MARSKANGAGSAISAAREHLSGDEHRLSNRAKIIQECCRELADLEGQRAAIGEEIRSLKQTKIKGDLGIKISDFNVAYRLYKLEDDNRTEFFDTLRETFNALGVGTQLSFLDAMDSSASGEAASA